VAVQALVLITEASYGELTHIKEVKSFLDDLNFKELAFHVRGSNSNAEL